MNIKLKKKKSFSKYDNLIILTDKTQSLSEMNFSEKELISEIEKIVVDQEIEIFVLGLPLNMKGQDSSQTKKVRHFKKVLSTLNLPIVYEDERFSSILAKNSLVLQKVKTGHNKSEIDRTAAAIILQQYLDKNSN